MEIIPKGQCQRVLFFLCYILIGFVFCQAIFRGGIANQFINTLLNVLADGSHELLREEIGLAIYAMASPDFEGFFQHLLPSYLLHCQGIEDYQRLQLKSSFSNDMVIMTDLDKVEFFIFMLMFFFCARIFLLLRKIYFVLLMISDVSVQPTFPTQTFTYVERLTVDYPINHSCSIAQEGLILFVAL